MKLDKKESDRIAAMAMLVVARKIATCQEKPVEHMVGLANSCRAEIKNILIEHLTQDQIAEIAASTVAARTGEAIQLIFNISIALTGKFQMQCFIESTEQFCSERLGRPVKVIQD